MEKVAFSPQIKLIWDACFQQSQLKTPFSTFSWHELYFSTIGRNEQPLILYNKTLNILAPLSVNGTVCTFAGGKEISDYMDLIGPEEHKMQAWNEIEQYLKQEGIQELTLSNIPESSSSLKFFQDHAIVAQEDTTPTIALPTTYEEYLAMLSRKDRHELERKLRKFNREHVEVEINVSDDPQKDMEILLQLMKLDNRKELFLTDDYQKFFRNLPEKFSTELILQFLYVQHEPVAAILLFKTETSLLLYNSGFDQIHHAGAGFYLKAENVHYAITQGYKEYNFLQGNERYKYELGGTDHYVYSIETHL